MRVARWAGGTGAREEPPNEGNIEAAASTTTTTNSQCRILARSIAVFYPKKAA